MSFGIRDYLTQAVQSLVEFCPHGFDLNLIASLFGAVSTLRGSSDSGNTPAVSLLAREVARKDELPEENASLKKGLEFLLGRCFSPGDL
jgi:hypothetical protein